MSDAVKGIVYVFLLGVIVATSMFGDDLRAAWTGGSNDNAQIRDVSERVRILENDNIANKPLTDRVESNTSLSLEIQRNQIKMNEQLLHLVDMVKDMQVREFERLMKE